MDITDTQGLRPTRQFIQAVNSINASFSDYWIHKMEDEAQTSQSNWKDQFPDRIKISKIFEKAYKNKKAAHSKGSFVGFQGGSKGTETPIKFKGPRENRESKKKPKKHHNIVFENPSHLRQLRGRISSLSMKKKLDPGVWLAFLKIGNGLDIQNTKLSLGLNLMLFQGHNFRLGT